MLKKKKRPSCLPSGCTPEYTSRRRENIGPLYMSDQRRINNSQKVETTDKRINKNLSLPIQ
jgi:hypothetical protein